MEIDEDKVDDAVLALLRLTLHDGQRAWKGFDWDALDRLHRKGLSPNPFAAVFSPVSDSSLGSLGHPLHSRRRQTASTVSGRESELKRGDPSCPHPTPSQA